jgi:hypothetical protein
MVWRGEEECGISCSFNMLVLMELGAVVCRDSQDWSALLPDQAASVAA